ncbi:hypothetical protein [Mycobacterium numidiamassiliense]|uniref:hypothetical protein n=1 Tax=Mycobacterium numidiamassiliense TaxID=1841861 RepID=UPI00097D255A|nr:hypothetical protein [Mycobacterium numidiamassiliense]
MNWTPETLARARDSHHEAGHAVAVVARGGTLVQSSLAPAQWSGEPAVHGATEHQTADENRAFVTFTGPWAEARWLLENEIYGHADLAQALAYVWRHHDSGDRIFYVNHVNQFSEHDLHGEFALTYRPWEEAWITELTPLWPAVCEVAGWLTDGQTVTHEMVEGAISRAFS